MMIVTSFKRGHLIYYDVGDDTWRYEDTDTNVESEERPCKHCGITADENGHDPCIQNLPNVDHACCGHGLTEGYIKFSDGRCIRGDFTSIHGPNGEIQQTFDH